MLGYLTELHRRLCGGKTRLPGMPNISNGKPRVKKPSEPILNVPPIVTATILALAFVHATRSLLLTQAQDLDFLLEFAFIPARYVGPLAGQFPGGLAADVWTFVTYALIHADLVHLGVNVAWLLPFGAAVARRFGSLRFLVFMAVTAAAGAGAQLLFYVYSGVDVELVGISGAISGLMGAAIRFVFQRHGPLGVLGARDDAAYRLPAVPLMVSLREPRVLIFLIVWFGTNLLFGVTVPIPGVQEPIAWQAHVGGFLAGLLLFSLFDPVTDDPDALVI
jgi:membrane associated rhomboid family serine protease